jgi:hypothetical protein
VIGIPLIFLLWLTRGKGKKCISCLVNEWITLSENEEMIDHAMGFYKRLFGKEPRSNIKIALDFWGGEEKVIEEENILLEAEFF